MTSKIVYRVNMQTVLRVAMLFGGLMLLGAGCVETVGNWVPEPDANLNQYMLNTDAAVVLPIVENRHSYRPSYRRFGEFFADGRFTGYHVGEDSEVSLIGDAFPVQVQAIANGNVRSLDWVSGYGGVMTVRHEYGCRVKEDYREGCRYVTALYGHIDRDSARFRVGDRVHKGDVLAELGDKGPETDGERKHLHFALYAEDDIKLVGYVSRAEDLDGWINPRDFFDANGATNPKRGWQSAHNLNDPFGRQTLPLDFELPVDWDIEWVPSLEAWNLYDTRGAGTARERSQVFIRYFDASEFLTLSTVTVHSTTETIVGGGLVTEFDDMVEREKLAARRYDIEKKPDAAAFKDQPSWRNGRHIVTDFRGAEGFTRYFVVAANPALDKKVYERILRSMLIVTENDSDERSN